MSRKLHSRVLPRHPDHRLRFAAVPIARPSLLVCRGHAYPESLCLLSSASERKSPHGPKPIGVLIYSFARISAALGMQVSDYFPQGKRWWLRLHEKGGKHHKMPAHHTLEEYLDRYIAAAGARSVCCSEPAIEIEFAGKVRVRIPASGR